MQITPDQLRQLRERLADFDASIAICNEQLSTYYRDHGHTNNDWLKENRLHLTLARQEFKAVMHILAIDLAAQTLQE